MHAQHIGMDPRPMDGEECLRLCVHHTAQSLCDTWTKHQAQFDEMFAKFAQLWKVIATVFIIQQHVLPIQDTKQLPAILTALHERGCLEATSEYVSSLISDSQETFQDRDASRLRRVLTSLRNITEVASHPATWDRAHVDFLIHLHQAATLLQRITQWESRGEQSWTRWQNIKQATFYWAHIITDIGACSAAIRTEGRTQATALWNFADQEHWSTTFFEVIKGTRRETHSEAERCSAWFS